MNEVVVPEISDEELETYLARKAPGTNVRTAISFAPTYSNIELIPIESIGIPSNRQRSNKLNGSGESERISEYGDVGLGLVLDSDYWRRTRAREGAREVIGGLPIPADRLPTAYPRAEQLLRFPRALFSEAAE